jgi:hypothetical protein
MMLLNDCIQIVEDIFETSILCTRLKYCVWSKVTIFSFTVLFVMPDSH